MKNYALVGALACSIGLAGCATNAETGAGAGCIIGGIAGALLLKDAKAGAALGCAVVGAAGFIWGKALDEKERRELAEASIRAADRGRTGERTNWGTQAIMVQNQSTKTQTATPNKTSHLKAGAPAQASAGNTNTSSDTANNGASGWVVPVSDTYMADGQTCRKLHQVATKDGATHERDITACKGTSGWVIPDSA